MLKIFHIVFILIVITLLSTCNNNNVSGDNIELNCFYTDVYNYKQLSDTDKIKFKDKYESVFKILYQDNCSDSLIERIPESIIYKSFIDDVKLLFGDCSNLYNILSSLSSDINYFTDMNIKYKYNLVLTPYNQSVIIRDSSLIVGINHYLGANHKMYKFYDEYKRKEKEPKRISYEICDVICRRLLVYKYNITLLDYIINEGLLMTMESEILNQSPFNILNYTDTEISWLNKNVLNAWNILIGKDLLYTDSYQIINDIIYPGPHAYSIDKSAPAKIGRLFGYQIIKKYLDKTNTRLNFDNLKKIAKLDSKYILLKSEYNGYN